MDGILMVKRPSWSPNSHKYFRISGIPSGIRTRVAALKGQSPRPLDDGDVEGARRIEHA
jgi:hypothetical protein